MRPADDPTPRVKWNDLTYIGSPNLRPNRETRRRMGIRMPLKVLDAYRDVLNQTIAESLPPPDDV